MWVRVFLKTAKGKPWELLFPVFQSSNYCAFRWLQPVPGGIGIAAQPRESTFCLREDPMSFIQVARRRFGIAGELLAFFWGNKRWWMLPMVIALFLFAALLILAQSSAIAPFIYTLF